MCIKISFIRVKILPYIMMHSYPYAEIFMVRLIHSVYSLFKGYGKARQNKYVCLGLHDPTLTYLSMYCVFCGECF